MNIASEFHSHVAWALQVGQLAQLRELGDEVKSLASQLARYQATSSSARSRSVSSRHSPSVSGGGGPRTPQSVEVSASSSVC